MKLLKKGGGGKAKPKILRYFSSSNKRTKQVKIVEEVDISTPLEKPSALVYTGHQGRDMPEIGLDHISLEAQRDIEGNHSHSVSCDGELRIYFFSSF